MQSVSAKRCLKCNVALIYVWWSCSGLLTHVNKTVMHRKYEYLRWTVHHQHPVVVSACPCENSVTSPNWNLTNIVKTFSSKLGQHPLPGPLIHLCVVWKNKTSHHGIMTPLLLLESCPVLNRSDNRELYIHLDTMTPLRYRKISTISIKICIYLQYL